VVADLANGTAREVMERAETSVWVKYHAVAMIAATLFAGVSGSAVPVTLAAGVSFIALAHRLRTRLGPPASLGGHANRLTAARLVLILCAATLLTQVSHWWLLLLLGLNVGMDVADGYLARRYDQVSHFGSVFDREADALFVLVVYLYYFLAQGVAGWVLLPGLLPYFYRLLVWKLRGRDAYEGKQRHAAMLAGANYVVLLVALAAPAQPPTRLLMLSSGVVLASFGLSYLKLRADEAAVS
jgi:phosphatidylglycerophosphate synthase